MKKKRVMRCMLVLGCVISAILTGCGENKNSLIPSPNEYIELGEYKGLEYAAPTGEITEEEIQDELKYLAGSYASVEELSEGKVEDGDIANIDYEGKLNGVAFEGGTAAGYDLTIGSHTFIDGFEDGLIGAQIGSTIDLNLTFPENYGSEKLAGQDVVFTVKINSVKRSILPEITDDFIKEISEGQYTKVDEYMKALEDQMRAENLEYEKLQMYADLLNMAVENATVKKDIPQEYIQSKVSRMLINAQDYAKSYGISFEDFLQQYMGMTKDEYNSQSIEYAKDAAKKSLVIRAIASKEGISVSDEELAEAIDKYVQDYGYASEEEFREKTNMDDFEEYVLTSKIEDFLYENANIK